MLLVIVAGLFFVRPSNYSPVRPAGAQPRQGGSRPTAVAAPATLGFSPRTFGVAGIFTAAALVFFAFIGFDIVATAAEETKNPQRDLPRGILGSLAICTVAVRRGVAWWSSGMEQYDGAAATAPLADAFRSVGQPASRRSSRSARWPG